MSPYRRCESGPDKALGLLENMMIEPGGRAVLSSGNLWPNPDGKDLNPDGSVRFLSFGSAPKPSGWWWYYKDTNGTAYERQGTRALDLHEDTDLVNTPVVRGGRPPDPADYAAVARPDPGLVELVPLSMIGYAARDWLVAIVWITGDPNLPLNRLSHTRASAPITLTLAQGQGFDLPLPSSDIPKGVTAVGIAMCPKSEGAAGLRLQEAKRIGRTTPPSVKMRGPYHAAGPLVNGGNSTYQGGPNGVPAPRVRRIPRGGALIRKGHYQFWVEEKTENGYTAGGQIAGWFDVADATQGQAFEITPARHVNGSLGFRVCVRYDHDGRNPQGNVFYVPNPKGGTDFRPGEKALMYTSGYTKDGELWGKDYGYPPAGRSTSDKSGVPDPSVSLADDTGGEGAQTFGGAPLTPGVKRIVWTWATPGERLGEDGESAPSDAVTVTIPGASGAATHTIRVHRPPGLNEVLNPRFTKLGLDDTEEDWTRNPGGGGAIHSVGGGQAHHDDRNGAATDIDIRWNTPVDISDLLLRVARLRLTLENRTAGRAEAHLRFLNGLGAEISREVLDDIDFAGEKIIERTHGPAGSGADIEWPAGAVSVQKVIRHVGSDPDTGARNLISRTDHFGHKPGIVHPPKHGVPEPVVGAEDPLDEYPAGGYTASVDSWQDSPQANVSAPLLGPVQFENGMPQGFDVVGNATISAVKPIFGAASLRCANGATPGGPAYVHYKADQANRTHRSDRLVIKAENLPSSGTARVYQVMDQTNTYALAFVQVSSVGKVWAVYRNAAGTLTQTMICRQIRRHDECDVEVHVDGAGSGTGRLRVWFAKQDNRRRKLLDISGIDWTGLYATDLRMGLDAFSAPSATAVFKYDHLAVQDDGSDAWTDLPGRMFEYYGPPGTPASTDYGFFSDPETGGPPVSPLTTYTFSFYLWYRGVTEAAAPCSLVIKDDQGNTIKTILSPAAGITGRRGWHRRWARFTAPEGAATVELRSSCGDGLIRVKAIQLENTTTQDGSPTPYTNQNALSGSLTMAYDLRLPGTSSRSLLNLYHPVERLRDAGYIGERPDLTDITVSFSSCPELEPEDGSLPVWTDYSSDLSLVPVGEGFKVRAQCTTVDPTASPEIADLFLDFARKGPVICRADGTEFVGGAVAVNFPTPKNTPIITPRASGTGRPGFSTFGERVQKVAGWKVEMYTDEAVEAFYEDLGEGPNEDSTYMVEALGFRNIVMVLDANFPTDRLAYFPIDGYSSGGYDTLSGYKFVAEGLEGAILTRSPL